MLTSKEAAAYLGISYFYLRNMRHLMHNHEGPPFVVAGKRKWCYYLIEELDEWKKRHKWRKNI